MGRIGKPLRRIEPMEVPGERDFPKREPERPAVPEPGPLPERVPVPAKTRLVAGPAPERVLFDDVDLSRLMAAIDLGTMDAKPTWYHRHGHHPGTPSGAITRADFLRTVTDA